MIPHYILLGIFSLVGIFSLTASLGNWEWFFSAQSLPHFLRRSGRKAARIYYACIGLLLVGISVLFFCLIQNSTPVS